MFFHVSPVNILEVTFLFFLKLPFLSLTSDLQI